MPMLLASILIDGATGYAVFKVAAPISRKAVSGVSVSLIKGLCVLQNQFSGQN